MPDFEAMTFEERHDILMEMSTELENYYDRNKNTIFKPIDADDITTETLKVLYIRYCRLDKQAKIHKKVQRYQIYMLIYFFILELICTKVLKIKASGFTVSSWKSIHVYDPALKALAEKSVAAQAGEIEPYSYLMMHSCGYLALFVFTNYLTEHIGESLAKKVEKMITDFVMSDNADFGTSSGGDMISNLLGMASETINSKDNKNKKKKEPTVKLDGDLPRPKYQE
jgi:hypothetical protein